MTISKDRLGEIEKGLARIVRSLERERQLLDEQFNCDPPDPLKSDQMKGWLKCELGREQ